MSKRKIDLEELRAKVRKMQQDIAGLTPLLEDDDSSDSNSEESTSSSVLAFQALTKEDGNKENAANNQQTSPKKVTVDPEVLEILGINANKDKDEVTPIDEDLVNIWKKLVNRGLPKEEKGELLEEYKRTPELEAKKLNAEILASLAPKNAKKDSYWAEIQNLIGSALMAIGATLTLLMREDECDKLELVKIISDVAKMNIAAHHAISMSRRANIFIPDLSPQVTALIKKAEMDETLYGNKLGERIKESQALTKLSQDIKQKPATNSARKPFLVKGPSQKKPFSAHTGSNQNRTQSRSSTSYRNKQQYFNSKTRNQRSSESSRRER